MLDFAQLKTPPGHGHVLVAPKPSVMAAAARENASVLEGSDHPILDSTLGELRRQTRRKLAGPDERLLIVNGHQPEFIHAGVWAKHVVAVRLAEAVEGLAVNLVVDNDHPKSSYLSLPIVQGKEVSLRPLRFAELPSDWAFEQIPPSSKQAQAVLGNATMEALGDRYSGTQMPKFFAGFAAAPSPADWVDQAVAGRRAVEANLGIEIDDHRVSAHWGGPLLADMLLHAERFGAAYNRALASYRKEQRIRGRQRPIPDLIGDDQGIELPVWAYRLSEPRRRLFVARKGETLRLRAGEIEVGEVSTAELNSCENVCSVLSRFEGWRFRPRALTLTLWARLVLADLFIHGIGGAKYDRITDRIIADYYGIRPPTMACVSATWLLDLPRSDVSSAAVKLIRSDLRDIRYNPQRHLEPGPELEPVLKNRAASVARSIGLRKNSPFDRTARRMAFDGIRAANASMLRLRPGAIPTRESDLVRALSGLDSNRVALSREFFFGLHTDNALGQLLQTLPCVADFRV